MIIKGQDVKEFTNMKEFKIMIKEEQEKYTVMQLSITNLRNDLGSYSTLERALEVMDGIERALLEERKVYHMPGV